MKRVYISMPVVSGICGSRLMVGEAGLLVRAVLWKWGCWSEKGGSSRQQHTASGRWEAPFHVISSQCDSSTLPLPYARPFHKEPPELPAPHQVAVFGSQCRLTWTSWFSNGRRTGTERGPNSWKENMVDLDLTLAKPVSMIRYAPSEKPSYFKLGMVMTDLPCASGKQSLT